MKKLISAKEVGVELGVHKVTIYRWVRQNIITPALVLPKGDQRFVLQEVIEQLQHHHLQQSDSATIEST